jgi:glycosyltransferase involved in cell wall biosynthesis
MNCKNKIEDMKITIISVIVTPPSYFASGGVAAGIKLSEKIANNISIKTLIMGSSVKYEDIGPLSIESFTSKNYLGWFRHILPKQLVSLFWYSPSLINRIIAINPDVVHIHNAHPALAFYAICRTCFSKKIKYIVSTHGFVELSDMGSSYKLSAWKKIVSYFLITRPFLAGISKASKIFMLSPKESNILDKLSVPLEKRVLVTNGYNEFLLEKASINFIKLVNNKFNIPAFPLKFLFVGNHTVNKGLDILLEAMHSISIPIVLIVAGKIRSVEEHELLLKKYRIKEVNHQIIFTDFITNEELRVIYQSVDAFVFPSRADTLPLVILDAMISSLPIISTNVGGIPYQVTSDTGILIEPNDHQALAKAVMLLATNPQLRRKLGSNGKKRAEQLFNWERSATDAINTYASLID